MYNPVKVEVKLGDWISEGFRMFAEQWQAWVLQTLVVVVILFVLMAIEFLGFIAVATVLGTTLGDASPVLILMMLPVFLSVSMIVGSGLICGMYKTAFKQLQGGKIELGDLFTGMDRFVPVMLAQLCIGVLTMVGFVLCIIPAFIVAGLLYFTMPLIIHKKLNVFEAMGMSIEVTKQNLLMFILYAFLVQLISQVGSYACYIGLLATFPLQFTMGVMAFRDCFGVEGARSFQPPAQTNAASYSAPPPGWPPSAVPPQNVVCPSCQTPMPPGAQFCPACGGGMR